MSGKVLKILKKEKKRLMHNVIHKIEFQAKSIETTGHSSLASETIEISEAEL